MTDVGSTKRGVAAAVSERGRFIGGHPICGSETRGPEHASGQLFEGATWFLTPVAETDAERYRALHGFVASLGAVPVAVDPRAHDRLVALTSHLPHALANVLVNQVGATRVDGHEPLAARGRVAAGHDARGGREPADLGRHLPRERRRAPRRARRAPAPRRAARAALAARDAGLPRALDRRGVGNRRRMLARGVRGSGRAPAAPRPRARPARRARGDHAGARRGADQHRGLRPPAHVARARRRR